MRKESFYVVVDSGVSFLHCNCLIAISILPVTLSRERLSQRSSLSGVHNQNALLATSSSLSGLFHVTGRNDESSHSEPRYFLGCHARSTCAFH